MERVECLGRVWTLESSDSYAAWWRSDKGDLLIAKFEKLPSLNGTQLPVYGESVEEILGDALNNVKVYNDNGDLLPLDQRNPQFIMRNNLLK